MKRTDLPSPACLWAVEGRTGHSPSDAVTLASAESAKVGPSLDIGHATKPTQRAFSPVGSPEDGLQEWGSRPFLPGPWAIGTLPGWDAFSAVSPGMTASRLPNRMTFQRVASFPAHPTAVAKDSLLCGRRHASGARRCWLYYSTEARCRQEQSLARKSSGLWGWTAWVESWLHQLPAEQSGRVTYYSSLA